MAQDLCVEVRGQFTRVGSLYFVRTRNRTKILRLDKCHLYKFLKAHMKNRRKKKCHSEVWESHFTYSVNALSIERRTVTVLSTPARAGSALGPRWVVGSSPTRRLPGLHLSVSNGGRHGRGASLEPTLTTSTLPLPKTSTEEISTATQRLAAFRLSAYCDCAVCEGGKPEASSARVRPLLEPTVFPVRMRILTKPASSSPSEANARNCWGSPLPAVGGRARPPKGWGGRGSEKAGPGYSHTHRWSFEALALQLSTISQSQASLSQGSANELCDPAASGSALDSPLFPGLPGTGGAREGGRRPW